MGRGLEDGGILGDGQARGASQALLRPAALRPGDCVAVVTPSGTVQAERLGEGIALLERRGFRVVPPRQREPYRCLAASDAERRADLIEAFADPEVRAVWCARGGYGLGRLLPDIDPAWLRRHAKLCIGFSDATALLQVLVHGAGVAALHGPMVASDLPRQGASALDHVLRLAAGEFRWRIPVPRSVIAGEAVGPLAGGCLTVIASLAGTPFAPRYAGHVVLLEDVGERPQRRIDRLLMQLRQSGILTGARGVLLGTMPDCGEADEICQTAADSLGDLGIPVGFGAPVGHGEHNFAVPLGVRVRLRVDGPPCAESLGLLEGLEPVVSVEPAVS